MTKPIVSVAFMMLIEQGRVQLQDPVTGVLPELAGLRVLNHEGQRIPLAQPVNYHHLLTHTAGLSYGFYDDSAVDFMYREARLWDKSLSRAEWLERVSALPLMHQPGEAWRYSIATDLIGLALERLTGQSLGELLEQSVFEPLDMVDTGFEVKPEQLTRFSTSYVQDPAGQLKASDRAVDSRYRSVGLHSGGGGLVSTIEDYSQFVRCLLNKGSLNGRRLIGRKTLEWMTHNHIRSDLLPLSYNGVIPERVHGFGFGLGFRVTIDPGTSQVMGSLGTYGWGGAANTVFWIDPVEDLAGILMTQIETDQIHSIRNRFRTLVYQALGDEVSS
jgi:CubicO group peptidase (beta-lactamase class C family)